MTNDSLYRPSGSVKDTKRTFVPDLYRQVAAEMQAEEGAGNAAGIAPEKVVTLQNRQIIGVLYSISAGIDGELFPVYIGRNTIGSDPECDICLRESSVSAIHGVLLARREANDDGMDYVNVILSDNSSSYGTSVNGERLNYERVACADGDVIRIGHSYELILSLFNAINKLSVATSFERLPPPNVRQDDGPVAPKLVYPHDGPSPDTPSAPRMEEEEKGDSGDASDEFYKPTAKQGNDHYNNVTIIL